MKQVGYFAGISKGNSFVIQVTGEIQVKNSIAFQFIVDYGKDTNHK